MNAKEFGNKVLKGLIWFLHSYIWLFIIFLATDIITKQCVARNMMPDKDSITLIKSWDANKPFLAITYVINTNAAFKLLVSPEYNTTQAIEKIKAVIIIEYFTHFFSLCQ